MVLDQRSSQLLSFLKILAINNEIDFTWNLLRLFASFMSWQIIPSVKQLQPNFLLKFRLDSLEEQLVYLSAYVLLMNVEGSITLTENSDKVGQLFTSKNPWWIAPTSVSPWNFSFPSNLSIQLKIKASNHAQKLFHCCKLWRHSIMQLIELRSPGGSLSLSVCKRWHRWSIILERARSKKTAHFSQSHYWKTLHRWV